jgi:REase_DpnII-MboI
MAVKKQIDNSIVYLIVDKEELKEKILERIQIGLDLSERQVSTKEEKSKAWGEFKDWNSYNEELVRQAFDKPDNRHFEEFKYKISYSVDAFYGEINTFQADMEEDKSVIKLQVAKLRRFYEKIELLKSPENLVKSDSTKNSYNNLLSLLRRFHKVGQAIRNRYDNRNTLIINNEYDVQDLLYGLLNIYFDDIRKEDFSPSHAGANSRIDFVLKKEKIIIEVKMTNDSLSINKLGQELLVDIGRYKEYPNCTDLIIFIYDKGDYVSNKTGFINDLQSQSTLKLKVTVIINPD